MFGYFFNQMITLAGLPLFYKNVFHIDIKTNSLYNAMPVVAILVLGNSSAFARDKIITSNLLSVATTRKLFYTVSMLGSSILFLASTYMSQDQALLTVIFMTSANGLLEMNRASININLADIAPNFCRIIYGIQLTISTCGYLLQPILSGYLRNVSAGRFEYRIVYGMCAGIAALASYVFLIFGKGEQLEWDKALEIEEEPLIE